MPVSPTARTPRATPPRRNEDRRRHLAATLISILLCAAALTQDAFFWSGSASSTTGWRLLLQGWQGLQGGYVEWLANPALLVTWAAALRSRPLLSLYSACSATLLMLVFLTRRSLWPGAAGLQIGSPHLGYWLWLGSALVMVVAGMRSPR